jgi:hypothetical protein
MKVYSLLMLSIDGVSEERRHLLSHSRTQTGRSWRVVTQQREGVGKSHSGPYIFYLDACHFSHISLVKTSHMTTLKSESVETCNLTIPRRRNIRNKLLENSDDYKSHRHPSSIFGLPERKNIMNLKFGHVMTQILILVLPLSGWMTLGKPSKSLNFSHLSRKGKG